MINYKFYYSHFTTLVVNDNEDLKKYNFRLYRKGRYSVNKHCK